MLMLGITAAFYITNYVWQNYITAPSPIFTLLINSLLGVTLVVIAVMTVGRAFRSRFKNPFASIIDTLQRIAKGDFTARLGEEVRGPIGELVQTVNNMALELDQMEKMRQEFISDVSHEIQSPLTSIRGFATALRAENLSLEDRRHYLDIIEAESTRLSKLSANLLKLASLEAKQVKFEPKPYRLDMQIRNLVLACEPQWTAKQLELDVTLDEASITADEDLLSQVWTNLLHNSIKFTPAGGVVRVALHRHGDRLVVSIADSGIGIAAEDQPHIFDRFFKADRARQSSEGGSGLGLSIAKTVVDLHHGTIAVKSQPGAGAVFTVEIPERV
jgi:two-component system phosphate regulon sensor histidine kinase PhoR